ncbi:MAG: ethylbenzene dehydrogenase-related protein [Aliidiomarina sp.]|uniref:ethylbenzene dehydrogenase-related protein n=1 Tax=Aliidiomarina sp. TaxID=1872439 RepID=UPI0025BE15CA|nr:ethylbenzene dehydrogenase-related protein [Aliidiomarina sp.]MCH8500793.1 ethylbenzene dehydrogenase-related protein [Aliidiomarina sp.]
MQRTLLVFLLILILSACSPREIGDPEVAAVQPAPETQLKTLYVAAEYDDEVFRLHYRMAISEPSWYHQYWLYRDGGWVRMGSGASGPDDNRLYEDRISMMLDDGSVEGFSRYGGWMLVHPGMRTLDSAVSADDVAAHPILGTEMGRTDVRKYIPQSRTVSRYTEPAAWDAVRPLRDIAAMQERGEFLDLWQWRAHRSHPLGYADNGYVLHYRLNSEGRGMYRDNAADEGPAYMFDAEQVGFHALSWDTLLARGYNQDDWYYLSEEVAVPIDAAREWQDGDVLPFRLLQEPDGARGAIRSSGGYADGEWRVTLTRSLASPNPLDSKTLTPGSIYHVAFAVHQNGVGARHHDVSLPHTLGLGVDADIVAQYSGEPFSDDDLEWYPVHLINPGQVTWEWLVTRHPGAGLIQADFDITVREHHGYLPLFQRYIERRKP